MCITNDILNSVVPDIIFEILKLRSEKLTSNFQFTKNLCLSKLYSNPKVDSYLTPSIAQYLKYFTIKISPQFVCLFNRRLYESTVRRQ